jgi:hypothetical protein
MRLPAVLLPVIWSVRLFVSTANLGWFEIAGKNAATGDVQGSEYPKGAFKKYRLTHSSAGCR